MLNLNLQVTAKCLVNKICCLSLAFWCFFQRTFYLPTIFHQWLKISGWHRVELMTTFENKWSFGFFLRIFFFSLVQECDIWELLSFEKNLQVQGRDLSKRTIWKWETWVFYIVPLKQGVPWGRTSLIFLRVIRELLWDKRMPCFSHRRKSVLFQLKSKKYPSMLFSYAVCF